MAINKRLLVKPPSTGITPSKHFGVVLYEGDGTTSHSINGGKFGAAGYFNGSSSAINTSYTPTVANLRTVSLWFKTNTTSFGTLFTVGPYGTNNSYMWARAEVNSNGTIAAGYGANNGGAVYTKITTGTFNDDNWHHLVLTLNGVYGTGSSVKLYIDGTEPSTTTDTTHNTAISTIQGTFRIGHGISSGANAYLYKGKLDQLRIFTKELSSSEVSTLYAETLATSTSLDPLSEDTTDTLQVLGDSSCIATYRFENNEDDLSGNYDATGYEIQYAAGRYGQALNLNGTSSYAQVGTSDIITGTTFSVSIWVLDEASSGYREFFSQQADNNKGLYIGRHNTTGTIRFNDLSISCTLGSSWNHLVFTVNGSTMKTYQNGSLINTKTNWAYLTSETARNGSGMRIGRQFGTYGEYWLGKIDQLRLFNKELSASEVTTLYNENSLVASYRFEGNANDDMRAYDATATNVSYEYGLNFTPDFVWIKERGPLSENHNLTDSTRGTNKILNSNNSNAEITSTSRITSFDTGGFTLGNNNETNDTGSTYAAWCWKANGGTTSTNTDGSITSTVQANTKAGFSIVTLNSGSTNGNKTTGHGLGVKPAFVLFRRISTSAWFTYHKGLSDYTKYLYLHDNLSESQLTQNTRTWGGQDFNTTQISWENGWTFSANEDLIAYCWAEVEGYSSFNSYTGNGSTNGPIVETGFEPAFLIVKRTDAAGDWFMYDNKRDTVNPNGNYLIANENYAENNSDANSFYFLSNGFKVNSTNIELNASGGTYIYMAFAADPDTEAPTVAKSFSTVAYAGTGSTQSIDSLGFKPNFVWFKERGPQGFSHGLYDSLRGANYILNSNLTSAQTYLPGLGYSGLQSFDSDGFTIGNNPQENASGSNYVAWAWKADDNEPTIFGSAPADDGVLNQNLISSSNLTLNTSGKFTNAITFNGVQNNGTSGSIIQISPYEASSSIDFTSTGGSFSAWLYITGRPASGHAATIFSYSGDMAFNIGINSSGYIWYSGATGGSGQRGSATTIPLNTWTHLVVTFSSGAEFKTYIDNSLVDTVTLDSTAITAGGTTVNAIGSTPNTGNNAGVSNWYYGLNGSIAQVRTFKKVLNSTEVGTLYNESASDNETLQILGDTSAIGVYPLNTIINESIVSANANAGFSIVQHTIPSDNTIPIKHGLSQAPEMIIMKATDSSESWLVYHSSVGFNKYLVLNSTAAEASYSGIWANVNSSTYTTVYHSAAGITRNVIAYCFHSLAGYSKIGSYAGNGGSNSITIGFQPDWVLIKDATSTGSWFIYDSVRSVSVGSNAGTANARPYIIANASGAENGVTSYNINLDSNGFSMNTSSSELNDSGQTYIYMAFKIN